MTPTDSQSSIELALKELRLFPRALWLDLARSDQSLRWRRRSGIQAEVYFRQLPEVRSDAEEALVLISGEVKLRREAGEAPTIEEYQQRFPDFADDIALQFSIQRILDPAADDARAKDREEQFGDLDLPGYVFLSEIARGATGVVYKARQ